MNKNSQHSDDNLSHMLDMYLKNVYKQSVMCLLHSDKNIRKIFPQGFSHLFRDFPPQ